MRGTRILIPALVAAGLLVACKRHHQITITVPGTNRGYFIDFVPLEPPTRSKLSTVEWTIVTSNGTITGSQPVVHGSDLTISFPGTANVLSFDLRGRDSVGRLRAEGVLTSAQLAASSESSPARLLFPLFGEFQAYSATLGPNLFGASTYIDSSGAPVIVGGIDDGVRVRSDVIRFDPLTGTTSLLGTLSTPRFNFTMVPRASSGTTTGITEMLLFGGGDASGFLLEVEDWDRVACRGAPFGASLSVGRSRPSVILTFVGQRPTYFALGGTTGLAVAGDIVSTSPIGASQTVPLFASNAGDAFFMTGAPPTVQTFYEWFGAASSGANDGLTYLSNSANSTGTFAAPARLGFAQRVDHRSNPVLWDTAGTCRDALELASTGAPPVLKHYAWSTSVCYPGVLSLSTDQVLVVGGNSGTFPWSVFDSVYNFHFSTGALTTALALDLSPQRLVYPRFSPTVVSLPDGRVVVIGGHTANGSSSPRFEVRVPLPN